MHKDNETSMATMILQPIDTNTKINDIYMTNGVVGSEKLTTTPLCIANSTASAENAKRLRVDGLKSHLSRTMSIEIPNPTPMREQALDSSSTSTRPQHIPFAHGSDNNKNLFSELAAQLNTTGDKNSTGKRIRFAPFPSKYRNDANKNAPNESGGSPRVTDLFTEEERRELWYQSDELASMKQEAKVIISNHRKRSEDPKTPEEREDMVGLERFSRQRAAWKRSAIEYVLRAQQQVRKLRNASTGFGKVSANVAEEYIRSVSLRCTGWARETASTQGFRDYVAVHDALASLFDEQGKNRHRNYDELIFGEKTSDVIRSTETITGDNNNKRKISGITESIQPRDHAHDGLRRVRQRA